MGAAQVIFFPSGELGTELSLLGSQGLSLAFGFLSREEFLDHKSGH
jgi:hypothetical protein